MGAYIVINESLLHQTCLLLRKKVAESLNQFQLISEERKLKLYCEYDICPVVNVYLVCLFI